MAQTTTVLSPTATRTPIPAKHRSRATLTCAPSTILRTPPLLFSAKPLSAKPLPSRFGANPPQKYIYPDPNTEFALAETKKFGEELMKKLSREKETFGDELDAVQVGHEFQKLWS